jgi:hypothetical protein
MHGVWLNPVVEVPATRLLLHLTTVSAYYNVLLPASLVSSVIESPDKVVILSAAGAGKLIVATEREVMTRMKRRSDQASTARSVPEIIPGSATWKAEMLTGARCRQASRVGKNREEAMRA